MPTLLKSKAVNRGKRIFAWLCALLLLASIVPIYAISIYNHPYYDDYNFSAQVRTVWNETQDAGATLKAGWESAKIVRNQWQGNYTGTLLSNFQPGVFSESLYFWGTVLLLTAFLIGFGFFFWTICRDVLAAGRTEAVIATSLLLFVGVQFLPNHSEAFFWFNGGVGNTLIYALLFASLAFCVKLERAQSAGRRVALLLVLALLMTLLGGGSYSGGVLGLCLYAGICLVTLVRKSPNRWAYLALTAWFLVCFLYSVTAPGNALRAGVLGASSSPLKAIAKALYYGVALLGNYMSLPILAAGLAALPMVIAGVKRTSFSFAYPWLVLLLGVGLFCSQLAPTLYSGVFLGGGRIQDAYWESFVAIFFLLEIYLTGSVVRLCERRAFKPSVVLRCGLPVLCACLLLLGCVAWKRPNDTVYGPQNTTGGSALLSLVTGEARQYDAEMRQREQLLNDSTQRVITLAPLSVVPDCFMEDPLAPDALYDARASLCEYYDKDEILIAGGDAN